MDGAKWTALHFAFGFDIELRLCNMGEIWSVFSPKSDVEHNNNRSERTNVKLCSLNKSQHSQQTENNKGFRLKQNIKRLSTSFEYVGDEFFSLDDGMMMQFCAEVSALTSSSLFYFAVAATLHASANSPAIWFSS